MAAEGHNDAPSAGEYIIHHLTHNQNHHQHGPADFTVINYDSLFFSITLGVVVCFLLYRAAKKASPCVPGRFQAAIEILFQMIEFVAKTVSHGMRLFGNMYAGELIFMLIALMGGALAMTGTGIALFIGHIVAGTVWSIFHLLIVWLQSFVFMMLTLVYVGQAHDHH